MKRMAHAKSKKTVDKTTSRNAISTTPPSPALQTFCDKIETIATRDGVFDFSFPGITIIRASKPHVELVHTIREPGLCFLAQGAKVVMVGNEAHAFEASQALVYSIELPIGAQVTRATTSKPYLGLTINIDAQKVADLAMQVYPFGAPRVAPKAAIYATKASEEVLDAATRLLGILQETKDAELLAPLVINEILIRLLRSPVGARLAEMGQADSSTHRIAKVTSWLRVHYAEPVTTEQLAEVAGMSVSSLHQHFKSITSLSPLQFQKILRLQEARRLMLSSGRDASTVSWDVGYASSSQFSREYSRFFGAPPSKDLAALRERGLSADDLFPE